MTTGAVNNVPKALKAWFVFHFVADITFAIPLFFFPESFLGFLGWKQVDPVASRLVAAALFAIGTESLLGRNSRPESFLTMLRMKIIWSFTAFIGLFYALLKGSFGNAYTGFSLFLVFLVFNIIWTYWFIKLKKK